MCFRSQFELGKIQVQSCKDYWAKIKANNSRIIDRANPAEGYVQHSQKVCASIKDYFPHLTLFPVYHGKTW